MPAKIERIAGLDDRLDVLATEFDEVPGKIKFVVKDGPNVIFNGWEIGSIATKPNRDGRFESCALYAVAGGGFVAARGWCSDREGEHDFYRAGPVETVRDMMDVLEWTTLAKQLAKQLRLDVNLYIGERAA